MFSFHFGLLYEHCEMFVVYPVIYKFQFAAFTTA